MNLQDLIEKTAARYRDNSNWDDLISHDPRWSDKTEDTDTGKRYMMRPGDRGAALAEKVAAERASLEKKAGKWGQILKDALSGVKAISLDQGVEVAKGIGRASKTPGGAFALSTTVPALSNAAYIGTHPYKPAQATPGAGGNTPDTGSNWMLPAGLIAGTMAPLGAAALMKDNDDE